MGGGGGLSETKPTVVSTRPLFMYDPKTHVATRLHEHELQWSSTVPRTFKPTRKVTSGCGRHTVVSLGNSAHLSAVQQMDTEALSLRSCVRGEGWGLGSA